MVMKWYNLADKKPRAGRHILIEWYEHGVPLEIKFGRIAWRKPAIGAKQLTFYEANTELCISLSWVGKDKQNFTGVVKWAYVQEPKQKAGYAKVLYNLGAKDKNTLESIFNIIRFVYKPYFMPPDNFIKIMPDNEFKARLEIGTDAHKIIIKTDNNVLFWREITPSSEFNGQYSLDNKYNTQEYLENSLNAVCKAAGCDYL